MENKVYRGEIYYIHETEVSGNEQAGGRPGIIVSNDVGNEHSPVVIVVYLTTKEKKPLPTHVKINTAIKPSVALCEQIETIYKGRIGSYIGQITDTEQKYIDRALAISIGVNLSIKSTKAVEAWAKMYFEEENTVTMEKALRKALPNTTILEEKTEVPVQREEKEISENIREELIRLETERNIYKGMYNELLGYMTEGKGRMCV